MRFCIATLALGFANASTWYKTITPDENHMLCLDAPGGSAFNGNMLWLWECNGQDGQMWVFDNYQIRYGADESFCIDAREMADGEQMMLWECNGLPQQTWGYDSDAKRAYIDGSSTCLDWYEGDNDNGQSLHVWECNGLSNQMWDLWDCDGCAPQPPTPSPTPSPTPVTPYFESCNDQSGGSWPVWNSESDLQNDGDGWGTYFTIVYGAVPSFGYPICMSGFRMLHLQALQSAGISISTGSKDKVGDYVLAHEFAKVNVGYIMHADCSGQCFGDNMWIEGLHCSTSKEANSAWYYFGTGSGVWVWSGSTKAWPTRKEFAAEMGFSTSQCAHNAFECGGTLFTTAKSKFGYDTVQYLKEHAAQGGGQPMFIATEGVGRNTCGASSTPWRAGWAAFNDCNCDQSMHCQNCAGYSNPGCGDSVAVV